MMYDKPVAPDWYRCQCGKHGVKLWRSRAFQEEGVLTVKNQRLLCSSCLLQDPKVDLRHKLSTVSVPSAQVSVDRKGVVSDVDGLFVKEIVVSRNFLPAIPCSEKANKCLSEYNENIFAKAWWESLPTKGDEDDTYPLFCDGQSNAVLATASRMCGVGLMSAVVISGSESYTMVSAHVPGSKDALEVLKSRLESLLCIVNDKLKEIEK